MKKTDHIPVLRDFHPAEGLRRATHNKHVVIRIICKKQSVVKTLVGDEMVAG